MDNEKKKTNPFIKIIYILFFVFIAFYIALESGYYPSRIEKKTIYTQNMINEFENDIKNGELIDKQGYLKKDEDYSNFVTKTGNSLTFILGKVIKESITGIEKTAKLLFW